MKTRFLVRISEDQRKLLDVALRQCLSQGLWEGLALEEADATQSMLARLPEDDAEFEQEEAIHDLAL